MKPDLKTREEVDWSNYQMLQRAYKKRVRSAKLLSYRHFSKELTGMQEIAWLYIGFQRGDTTEFNTLKRTDASYTEFMQEAFEL